jgi:hypothetical protein
MADPRPVRGTGSSCAAADEDAPPLEAELVARRQAGDAADWAWTSLT